MARGHHISVRIVPVILALLAWPAVAHAAGDHAVVPTPDEVPGTVKVDAEGLIDTLARIPNLVIIDSRISMDRKQGYIEESISLPDTETDCDSLEVALDKPDTPVLFYCNGPKCGRSVKAIHKAQACGYRMIYWFRGGFEEWTAKGYPFLKE
jgi:rhodanese-related sulfurtransferase